MDASEITATAEKIYAEKSNSVFPSKGGMFPTSKHSHSVVPDYNGLTKLEYFAGLAMQGILSNPTYMLELVKIGGAVAIERAAVVAAEGLIKALDECQKTSL